MHVDKIAGDTFDAIVELFPKIIPNAKINSSGWWSFIGPYGKSKLNSILTDPWESLIINMLMRNRHGIYRCA